MKFNNIFLATILGLGLTSIATARGHDDDFGDREWKSKPRPTEFTANGYIFCESQEHKETGKCDLQFERKSDGKIFDIINTSDLLAAHCKNHKDLEVSVDAKIEEFNFFSNDEIKVREFKLLSELEQPRVETQELARLEKQRKAFRDRDNWDRGR